MKSPRLVTSSKGRHQQHWKLFQKTIGIPFVCPGKRRHAHRSGLMYHLLFQGVEFTKSVGPPGSGGLTRRHALPIDGAIDVDSVEEGESPVEAGAARV